MKYLEDRHFLYPVLLPDADNYPGGMFRVSDLQPEIQGDHISLSMIFHLQEPSIQRALDRGVVRCGAVLYCPATLYRRLATVPMATNTLEVHIARSQIHRALEINPLVYVLQEFLYEPHTAHAEYGDGSWRLKPGFVLAQDETQNLTFPPPAFLQHYVMWRIDEEMRDNEFRLDKEQSRFLIIYTNQPTRKSLYRQPDYTTKPSFYLAVLHEVMAYIQMAQTLNELEAQRENREWLAGFLDHLALMSDFDLEDMGEGGGISPWQAAQKLLDYPYGLLTEQEGNLQ